MTFQQLIIFFVFFSYFGYFLESIVIYAKCVNTKQQYKHPRYGPLPMSFPYGFGGVFAMIVLTSRSSVNIFTFLIICFISFTLIEYISAIFSEKIIGEKYWDYSYIKYNFQGRISLRTSLIFMVCGVFLYLSFPFLSGFLKNLPSGVINILYLISWINIIVELLDEKLITFISRALRNRDDQN
ncbi:putative ABC transporter permease [Candidatus Dojkabacteria bacterium]|nr:putative ABC transporter permease [Candidatus Dojkabacteria bacterium]